MNNKLHYTKPEKQVPAFKTEYPAPREIFAAEIIFGSPKKNCAGAGICKVNSPASHQSDTVNCLNCNRAAALICIEAPQTVVFQFVIKSMSRAVILKHFENDVFLVEAPFQFKKSFWHQTSQWAIPPGAYPVERTEDYLIVRFNNLPGGLPLR